MGVEVEQRAVEGGEGHRGQRPIEGTLSYRDYRISWRGTEGFRGGQTAVEETEDHREDSGTQRTEDCRGGRGS
jgi:hypothetical protein